MTEQVSPEAIEAMTALVRSMARPATDLWGGDYDEARRITALLPKPVDQALLACREICASAMPPGSWILMSAGPDTARYFREGEEDDGRLMSLTLAAYAAGKSSK